MLEETLDRALQKTIYWHQMDLLEPSRRILEQGAGNMFAAQSYDILWAVFQADLDISESKKEDDDRRIAVLVAAIAAVLALRLSRDVTILRPGILGALTAAVVNSGLGKYGVAGNLRAIDAERYLLEHGAELVTQINEFTRENMARILAKGVRAGDSVEDIASRLMQTLDDMTWPRARRIAITETSKAWSYAEMQSAELMEQSGYKMVKEWLLGPMHPRYDPCDHNHEAGAIPLHQAFPAGDMAPPQHPNCGCSLITYPAGGDQPWGAQVLGQTPMMPFGIDTGDDNA